MIDFEQLKNDLEMFNQEPNELLGDEWLQDWGCAAQRLYDLTPDLANLSLIVPELQEALIETQNILLLAQSLFAQDNRHSNADVMAEVESEIHGVLAKLNTLLGEQ